MLINCISLDRMRCSDYSKCQHMHEQSMNHISLKKYRPQMLCKVTHCAGRAHGASYTQEMQLVTKRLTIFMPISVESIDGYGQLLPEGNHMIEKQQRPQNLVSHSCHDQISNYNCRVIGTFCCQHFVATQLHYMQPCLLLSESGYLVYQATPMEIIETTCGLEDHPLCRKDTSRYFANGRGR